MMSSLRNLHRLQRAWPMLCRYLLYLCTMLHNKTPTACLATGSREHHHNCSGVQPPCFRCNPVTDCCVLRFYGVTPRRIHVFFIPTFELLQCSERSANPSFILIHTCAIAPNASECIVYNMVVHRFSKDCRKHDLSFIVHHNLLEPSTTFRRWLRPQTAFESSNLTPEVGCLHKRSLNFLK